MTQHAPIELTDGEAASGQADPEATDPESAHGLPTADRTV